MGTRRGLLAGGGSLSLGMWGRQHHSIVLTLSVQEEEGRRKKEQMCQERSWRPIVKGPIRSLGLILDRQDAKQGSTDELDLHFTKITFSGWCGGRLKWNKRDQERHAGGLI